MNPKRRNTRVRILSTLMARHQGLWQVEIAKMSDLKEETVSDHLGECEKLELVTKGMGALDKRYFITPKGMEWLKSEYVGLAESGRDDLKTVDIYNARVGYVLSKEVHTEHGVWNTSGTVSWHTSMPDPGLIGSFQCAMTKYLLQGATPSLELTEGTAIHCTLAFRKKPRL